MLDTIATEARSADLELPYSAYTQRQRHQANPSHRWGAGGATFTLSRPAPCPRHVPRQLYSAGELDLRAGTTLMNQSYGHSQHKEALQTPLRVGWGRHIRRPTPYIQTLSNSPFKPYVPPYVNPEVAHTNGRGTFNDTTLPFPKATHAVQTG